MGRGLRSTATTSHAGKSRWPWRDALRCGRDGENRGFAAWAPGAVDEAQRTFRAALERAHASAAISLELLALSGVDALLSAAGEREQAATVLTFALGHEQLPEAYSFAARPAAAASLEDLVTQALEPIA